MNSLLKYFFDLLKYCNFYLQWKVYQWNAWNGISLQNVALAKEWTCSRYSNCAFLTCMRLADEEYIVKVVLIHTHQKDRSRESLRISFSLSLSHSHSLSWWSFIQSTFLGQTPHKTDELHDGKSLARSNVYKEALILLLLELHRPHTYRMIKLSIEMFYYNNARGTKGHACAGISRNNSRRDEHSNSDVTFSYTLWPFTQYIRNNNILLTNRGPSDLIMSLL